MINEFFSIKVLPKVIKFSEIKFISAMKNGLVITMPFTIIGSIFLILSSFPYQPIADFIASLGWTPYLDMASGATFNLMAIYTVIALSHRWVKDEGYDGTPASLFALAAFAILLPPNLQVLNDNGKAVGTVTNIIDKTWTGSQGMIGALLVGAVVGTVYVWFMKRNLVIKMPDGVPENVSGAFTAIIPGFAIILGALLVQAFFQKIFEMTLLEAVYQFIQTPIQGLTDSAGGLFLFIFLMCGFWALGIHGPLIVNGIMGPILLANTLENAELAKQGTDVLQEQGNVFIQPLIDQFVNVTGTGMTIGLVLFMVFFAKSKSFKELGKLGIFPMIFNINEPILFGTPVVLNPLLIPPFLITPLVSGMSTYYLIKLGILPVLSGIQLPWTTPPIISGYLIGGWKFMVWQIIVLLLSVVIYFPFAKIADKVALEAESN